MAKMYCETMSGRARARKRERERERHAGRQHGFEVKTRSSYFRNSKGPKLRRDIII